MPIIILWTGPKHSGKTTRALDLVKSTRKEGYSVAGLLAPSIYNKGKLIGFYAYDLINDSQKQLAVCNKNEAGTRHFTFLSEGLKVGVKALSKNSIKNADLIIVDEFGRFELSGRIWRKSVESILSYGNNIILLIVQKELVKDVVKLYSHIPYERIAANETDSIKKVVNILKYREGKSLTQSEKN